MFPQIFGKYVLEREIAAGGMARVFLATLRGAVGFEKRLVVKQIRAELANDDAFVRRFVEEAKTSVELSHPNIVPVYELGVEQGVFYIAMELCEGVTLAEVLGETGPLEPEEGAYLGVEICRALDYAHRRGGVVHRDVTPRNVLIDEEGAVRLIDFGIAAPVTRDATGRHEIFGSPGHMPPEQLRGERLTPATDVFAMGALLVEAWTGQPPFRRNTPEQSEQALASGYNRVEHEIPGLAVLGDLISAALSLEPEARPVSAELLARPLREFLKSSDLGEVARRVGARVRKTRRRESSSSPWLPGEGLLDATAGTPSAGRLTPRAAAVTPSSETAAPFTPRPAGVSESGTPGSSRTPSGVPQAVTRTFAARGDLVVWTRKLPSVPPSGPQDAPAASGSARQNPSLPPESARSDPVKRRHDEDASPTTAPRVSPDPARAASNYRLIAAVLAGMVIAGLISTRLAGRSGSTPASSEPVANSAQRERSTSEPIRAPTGSVSVSPSAPPSTAPSAAPIGSSAAKPLKTSLAGPGSGKPAASSGSPEQCSMMLISNLTATATVDGRPYKLRVEQRMACGAHLVVFHSPDLREDVEYQAKLAPGRMLKVIVDFSGAKPRVWSQ